MIYDGFVLGVGGFVRVFVYSRRFGEMFWFDRLVFWDFFVMSNNLSVLMIWV